MASEKKRKNIWQLDFFRSWLSLTCIIWTRWSFFIDSLFSALSPSVPSESLWLPLCLVFVLLLNVDIKMFYIKCFVVIELPGCFLCKSCISAGSESWSLLRWGSMALSRYYLTCCRWPFIVLSLEKESFVLTGLMCWQRKLRPKRIIVMC